MFGLGAIVTAIMPLVTAAVTAYNKSKDVSIAAIQSAGTIASAQAQAMTAWIGHPLSPPSLMCYFVAFHFGKSIVWDPHLALFFLGRTGFTPHLEGGTKEIAMIVVSGMFFSGIANIIKR
jgi:hypothetical protein